MRTVVKYMEEFYFDADSIRESADLINTTGIDYLVQQNIARCLMTINKDKASGNSVLDIGLPSFILMDEEWLNEEELESVRELIFKGDYIPNCQSEFIESSRQKSVYLQIICNTIYELKKRKFSVTIFLPFGLPIDDTDPELYEIYMAIGKEINHLLDCMNPHDDDDRIMSEEDVLVSEVQKIELLEHLKNLHRIGGDFLSNMTDSYWVKEYLVNSGRYHIPSSWEYHFVPCVTLSIGW